MQNIAGSPSSETLREEIDLVDIIGFLWRGRLIIAIGVILGLIAGVAYTYVKRKSPLYASDVAMDVKFPIDLQASGQIPQLIDHWNANILSEAAFQSAYGELAKIAPEVQAYRPEAAFSQQTGAAGDVPKTITYAFDDTTQRVIVAFNVPFALKSDTLKAWAKSTLLLTMPHPDGLDAKGGDPPGHDIPSYEYVTMEYDLFQKIESLGINAKSYLDAFRDQNASSYAANLLRMIAILEAHQKLNRAEAEAMATKALALVPHLLISSGNLSGATTSQAGATASAAPISVAYSMGDATILRENVPVTLSRKRESMVLVGLVIIGTFLGLLITAAHQFWQANRKRLRDVLA